MKVSKYYRLQHSMEVSGHLCPSVGETEHEAKTWEVG